MVSYVIGYSSTVAHLILPSCIVSGIAHQRRVKNALLPVDYLLESELALQVL